MKKKRKYTISEKRRLRDAKQADWSKRMRVVELRDSGMKLKEIGDLLGCTKANVLKLYRKAKKGIPDQIAS